MCTVVLQLLKLGLACCMLLQGSAVSCYSICCEASALSPFVSDGVCRYAPTRIPSDPTSLAECTMLECTAESICRPNQQLVNAHMRSTHGRVVSA